MMNYAPSCHAVPRNFRQWFTLAVFGLAFLLPLALRADGGKNDADSIAEGVQKSAKALSSARPQDAIVLLESLADQGFSHPELSFNRALGYLARSKTSSARPGDLGQSAAAFAETLQARPDDPEAKRGLSDVQILVARKAAKDKHPSENQSLGLMGQLLRSLNPWLLFILGALGSLACCIGLILQHSSSETRKTGAKASIWLGALGLILASGLFLLRSQVFGETRVAVIISARAQILDEAGARIKGIAALREGTVVHVGQARRGIVPLRGVGKDSWIRLGQVRILVSESHSHPLMIESPHVGQ